MLVSWPAPPGRCGPEVHLVEHERIELSVRPLAGSLGGSPGPFSVAVDEVDGGRLEFQVAWPPSRASRVRVEATRALLPAAQAVRLSVEVAPQDGSPPLRRVHELVLGGERTTALFEVARVDEHVLSFYVEVELSRESRYSAQPVIGAPVQFHLEIQWIERGQAATLETNQLNSFVGQPVGYSFRLGETGAAAAASVRLSPLQLVGQTARIDLDLSATLPDADGAVRVVSRREEWLATSGTTTILSLENGDPPTGFRFLVTARF
jgi:hypothetical protein